jgi:hypothetical protein
MGIYNLNDVSGDINGGRQDISPNCITGRWPPSILTGHPGATYLSNLRRHPPAAAFTVFAAIMRQGI